MGHSTLDIPVQYLMPAARHSFLHWVRHLPVTVSVKSYLLSTWSRAVDVKLHATDYEYASRTNAPAIPHAP